MPKHARKPHPDIWLLGYFLALCATCPPYWQCQFTNHNHSTLNGVELIMPVYVHEKNPPEYLAPWSTFWCSCGEDLAVIASSYVDFQQSYTLPQLCIWTGPLDSCCFCLLWWNTCILETNLEVVYQWPFWCLQYRTPTPYSNDTHTLMTTL